MRCKYRKLTLKSQYSFRFYFPFFINFLKINEIIPCIFERIRKFVSFLYPQQTKFQQVNRKNTAAFYLLTLQYKSERS